MNKFADLIGRILIALIFVMAGMNKVMHYDATVADMALHGLPGMLLPVVIFTELVGGILIIIGFQTRLAALALAGFSIVTGLLMHAVPVEGADVVNEGIMLMKNLAMAGGFLFLFVNGAGPLSFDRKWGKA
ncbi:MAG: DoxX family protein [Xanthomonadaceae bacterium]|nr:DoxX family protein [Xanthomonadaceae bacterium]MDP2186455.1 DoxX family protein [Xanthomonadales bacterium]MDZ4115153.1 DoxX family protein [Xanthomonadaceae bacterium]MDZ4377795.1 DoxX family protein [Xanthomonadaceae bacterium]